MTMPRSTRSVLLVALAATVTLTTGIGAAARGVTSPSALPTAAPGHPGNPVVLKDSSWSITGRAGEVVHLRLTQQLTTFASEETSRWSMAFSGEWGGASLSEDGPYRPNSYGSVHTVDVFEARPSFSCGAATRCYSEEKHRYVSFDNSLAPGDYVLVLSGPVGSTVTFTTTGYEDTHGTTTVTGYPRPYLVKPLPAVRVPSPSVDHPYKAYGSWYTPMLGREQYAGVLLGMLQPTGGGVSFTLCPGNGSSRPSYQTNVVAATATNPSCSGYVASFTNVSSANALNQPLPGAEKSYALLQAAAYRSLGQEGLTGGAWGYGGPADAHVNGVAFVVDLDG